MSGDARSAILARLTRAVTGLPRPSVPAVAPGTDPGRARPAADFATLAAGLDRLGVPFELASDPAAVAAALAGVIDRHRVRVAALWNHPDIEAAGAAAVLARHGVAVRAVEEGEERPGPALAEVDLGLTGVAFALCATGSLVLLSGPGTPRVTPLVPRLHVALVARSRLLPDLPALVGALSGRPLPAAVTCVSGVSSTGDIEFVYVKGVHGPLAVHVIGLEWL